MIFTPPCTKSLTSLGNCESQGYPLASSTNRTKLLQEHVTQLTILPSAIPHEQVLKNLLDQIEPVDFRDLANLADDREHLRTSHYTVIVVEQVLSIAAKNGCGLCRSQGSLYVFNRSYWKKLGPDNIQHFLKVAAERLGVPPIKARHYGFGEQLYKQFLDVAYLNLPSSQKDQGVVQVNLRNGTFDIGSDRQELRPPAASDFITHELPFAYDPAATAPRWQEFLNRVVPDIASQRVLAEFMGYVFISPKILKLEKVLLLYGSGANGKSVFFEVITALLCPENIGHNSLASLTKEPAYARMNLANKLVNYASELSSKIEIDTFKQLASGEPIEARLPYGMPVTIDNYAKLIFNTNELPTAVEHTPAFFRRLLIVPFSVTIPENERDPGLATAIITEELAGVFNWVLIGLRRLLEQRRFSQCEVAQQQLDIYKVESDSVLLFLQEAEYESDLKGDSWLPTIHVYTDYRSFCTEYGCYPVARGKFVSRLREANICETRRSIGKVLSLKRKKVVF